MFGGSSTIVYWIQDWLWYKSVMSNEEGLRERKKRATRQAISDIATRLFIERGFDNVTVADVATAANVAKMTVFNYFPRKEDLFFDRDGESRELLGNALGNRTSGESPILALQRFSRELQDQRHPFTIVNEAISRFWRTAEQSDALRARAREMRETFVCELATMIADSIGQSRRDPLARLLAELLVTAWHVAYAEALRVYRTGARSAVVRAAFEDLLKRGFVAVTAATKGTPYE
jgi:AcrR family transcriptional regulator